MIYFYLSLLILVYFMMNYKHMLVMLILLEFLVLSIVIIFFFIFSYFSLEFYMIYYMIFNVCESVMGLMILIMIIRSKGDEMYSSINLFKN